MAEQPTIELTAAMERVAVLLGEVFEPAGALMWFAARHQMLGGDSPADMYRRGDINGLDRAADRLESLADGTFL